MKNSNIAFIKVLRDATNIPDLSIDFMNDTMDKSRMLGFYKDAESQDLIFAIKREKEVTEVAKINSSISKHITNELLATINWPPLVDNNVKETAARLAKTIKRGH